MKSSDKISRIPKTGRIGRFAKIVANRTHEDSFVRIMEKSDKYGKYKPDKQALWWSGTIERLEDELGPEGANEVMRTCGSKCCGKGQRKTARRLMKESSSVEDFLKKISTYEVRDGELEYKMIDKNTIIGKHNRCFCGQVKKSKDLFKNSTYCQCSVAFNEQFFEAAFERPVEVVLKQSILLGGDYCEFEINLKN